VLLAQWRPGVPMKRALPQPHQMTAEDARLISTGIGDETIQAIVKITGALMPLEPHEQARVLRFITDHFGIKTG